MVFDFARFTSFLIQLCVSIDKEFLSFLARMKESLFTYTVYDTFQFYTEILFKMLKNGFVC